MNDPLSDVPGRAMQYQDYVIKDGKLVGRFEEMYQAWDDPWHQSSVAYNARLLAARGIPWVDPLNCLRSSGPGLYFTVDLHLTVTGHRRFASCVEPALARIVDGAGATVLAR